MNKRLTFWIAFIFILIEVPAQDSEPLQQNSSETEGTEACLPDIYRLQQINQSSYYHDKAKLDHIRQLYITGSWPEFQCALSEYVSQFGIKNFLKDSYLIWKLAEVTEKIGDIEKAMNLYLLAMRHHRVGVDQKVIEQVEETIEKKELSLYVSVDFFNEMAQRSRHLDSTIYTLEKPKNLGKNVNSHTPEYAPAYHPASQTLIFTSQRKNTDLAAQSTQNEDLYFSTKGKDGEWAPAQKFHHINTPYNEGSGCLSADGKTLYFSRCNCPGSMGSCDLFMTQLQEDSTWGEVKNLGAKVNSSHWDSHPTLSHSGDTLYFTSDRPGGFGLSDLYFTYKDFTGSWTRPQNMGPVINTKNHDLSPYYHPIYNVLYFSSNGQPVTFGEFDIFKVENKGDTWGEPVNTGPQVNSNGSEMYFSIDPVSNLIFLARSASHDLSKQDLYSLPLPMKAQPHRMTTLRGYLRDSLSGKPLEGVISVRDKDSGIEVMPKFIASDGTFEFDLIDNHRYSLVVRGKDFFRVEDEVHLHGPTTLELNVGTLAPMITFRSINFDFDKYELKEYMIGDLNKIVFFLHDNPHYQLKISGHTDNVGTDEYNHTLSTNRAKSIAAYITHAGVDETRVAYEGFGNTRPLVKEITDEDRAINRRVEFYLYMLPSEIEYVDDRNVALGSNP